MPSYVLTDLSGEVWIDSFEVSDCSLGLASGASWKVAKRRLSGGRREGVDLVELDNGALRLSIVPTRGMGLWRGQFGADRLGWDSPTRDGPVHPALVNLMNWGGLGWVEGFDELMVRCGLEHNGAPYEVKTQQADGTERNTTYSLHGKIANIPAHYVAVHIQDEPPHAITVEGHVDESKLFGPQIRMVTRITTVPGSSKATVRDEFQNLGDLPCGFQLLYHWNFGPPYLEEGSKLVAPARRVVPRDARAVEGLSDYETYGGPEPGFSEQVYFFELMGEGEGDAGRTLTMLKNRSGEKAVALRFSTHELPCFTQWKNTAGAKDGYVTGLEPATNYPNPKPFEQARGRVIRLAPGETRVAEVELEVFENAAGVAGAEAEIERCLAGKRPDVAPGPVEPFALPA